MSKPPFLFDECTDPDLLAALRRAEPAVDVIRVGDAGAPPRGTPDPNLLVIAQGLGRVFVSNDRSTLPGHLIDHFSAGRHTAGIIMLRRGYSIGRFVQELVNQWSTTTTDDWVDRTIYLP